MYQEHISQHIVLMVVPHYIGLAMLHSPNLHKLCIYLFIYLLRISKIIKYGVVLLCLIAETYGLFGKLNAKLSSYSIFNDHICLRLLFAFLHLRNIDFNADYDYKERYRYMEIHITYPVFFFFEPAI